MAEEEVHLKCEPSLLTFTGPYDKRTQTATTVANDGKKRIALKIRTSDNSLFKVNMVYAFMDPGATKQLVIRCNPFQFDSSKEYNHRIAVVYTGVDETATNPQEVFKATKDTKEVMMKVEFKPGEAAPAAPPAEGAAAPAEAGAAPAAAPVEGGAAPPTPVAVPPAEGAAPAAEGGAPPAEGGAPPAEGGGPPAEGGAPPAASPDAGAGAGTPPEQQPPA